MDEPSTGDATAHTLSEAADLTGLSVAAIRKRIERKALRATRSNVDKQLRVWLTVADIEAARAGQSSDSSDQGELVAVRDALAREIARLDKAEAETVAAKNETVAALSQAAAATLRAAVAEAKLEAAQAALAEARRPWWRRLMGD
jgi:3-oxoacyl-ACP reductase-like protein